MPKNEQQIHQMSVLGESRASLVARRDLEMEDKEQTVFDTALIQVVRFQRVTYIHIQHGSNEEAFRIRSTVKVSKAARHLPYFHMRITDIFLTSCSKPLIDRQNAKVTTYCT